MGKYPLARSRTGTRVPGLLVALGRRIRSSPSCNMYRSCRPGRVLVGNAKGPTGQGPFALPSRMGEDLGPLSYRPLSVAWRSRRLIMRGHRMMPKEREVLYRTRRPSRGRDKGTSRERRVGRRQRKACPALSRREGARSREGSRTRGDGNSAKRKDRRLGSKRHRVVRAHRGIRCVIFKLVVMGRSRAISCSSESARIQTTPDGLDLRQPAP